MTHYESPDVEVQNLEPTSPLAASGNNEGFGSKPGTYDFLKPFILLLFAGLLTACHPDPATFAGTDGFTASLEAQKPQSRTSLSGASVLWSAGDTIAVYKAAEPAAQGEPFGLNAADDGSAEGRFSSEQHNDWTSSACYALYPARMDGGLTGTTLAVNLPAEQQYRKASFGPQASPAVARGAGDGKLAFSNLCGLLAVSVTAVEPIAEVRVTTLGAEALWGPGTVDMTYGDKPVLVMAAPADDAQKTLTLKVDENPVAGQIVTVGSTVNVTDGTFTGTPQDPWVFYFVVPSGSLAQGFLVSIVTADGKYMQQYAVASSANLIERSCCTEMPDVAFNNQAEVEIRTDVPNKAFYKDFLNEDGVGLSDYKTLTVTNRLSLSTETVYTRTNDAANQAAQNSFLIGNENDENGILLYPDGEPRYRMMYVNGGQSYTHGPSLMAEGRENFRKFVYGGGSYLASCAGSYVGSRGIIEAGTTTSNPAMMAYNGYIGLWPGLVDNTGLTNAYPDYVIPESSPLLHYDNFGGDFRVDSIKQWNGPYFSEYASVPGTEVLAYFDYPAYRCHNHPSIISYKPSPFCGRITLIGGHPEQYADGLEGADLMDALVKYALDHVGIAKIKGILRNGELRSMTKPTSANDPAHAKVGDRQCHHFAFGLPAGARNIRIRLEVLEDFNVSLRLAQGTFAFAEDAQYRVENGNLVKELSFDTLASGTWYIGVQCEDTVTNDASSTYGISYSGKIAALNGAPYTIQVTWE